MLIPLLSLGVNLTEKNLEKPESTKFSVLNTFPMEEDFTFNCYKLETPYKNVFINVSITMIL